VIRDRAYSAIFGSPDIPVRLKSLGLKHLRSAHKNDSRMEFRRAERPLDPMACRGVQLAPAPFRMFEESSMGATHRFFRWFVAAILVVGSAFAWNASAGEDGAARQNDACLISGERLAADAPTAAFDGKSYGFCCKKCAGKFEAMSDDDKRALIAKATPAAAETKPAAREEKPAELTLNAVYALGVCPMSGEELGADAVTKVFDGRQVRFCCQKCAGSFEKDTAKGFAKVDELIVKQQGEAYPLDTCVISGEPLTEMGEPVNVVTGNRLVKVCCQSCVRKVNADPSKVLAKLDAAVKEKQMASYPLDVCVIAGDSLTEMGESVDVVVANRLVRLCCDHCVGKVMKDPAGVLARLDEAAKAKAK
jgi:hypothetical protein